jgi:hypothetical protein
MTDLVEMTRVMLAKPGPGASDIEVAAWYELKAQLLEHIAADGGPGATEARQQADAARLRSAELRGHCPRDTGVRPISSGVTRHRHATERVLTGHPTRARRTHRTHH